MNHLYNFLGYRLTEIHLNKYPGSEIKQIRLKIEDFKLDKKTIHLISSVEIDYDDSKDNRFVFVSGYEIMDEQMEEVFENKDEGKVNEYLQLCYSSVYPFVRESVSSITRDTGNMVMLPIIDCRGISLQKSIIFIPYNNND